MKRMSLMLALASCTDRAQRDDCERIEHRDTTGNLHTCACVCESNAAAQCPMLATDPMRSAIPACWDEGSSST